MEGRKLLNLGLRDTGLLQSPPHILSNETLIPTVYLEEDHHIWLNHVRQKWLIDLLWSSLPACAIAMKASFPHLMALVLEKPD